MAVKWWCETKSPTIGTWIPSIPSPAIYSPYIPGWWFFFTPLKNRSSSIGMIRNSQYEWENKKIDGHQTTNQPFYPILFPPPRCKYGHSMARPSLRVAGDAGDGQLGVEEPDSAGIWGSGSHGGSAPVIPRGFSTTKPPVVGKPPPSNGKMELFVDGSLWTRDLNHAKCGWTINIWSPQPVSVLVKNLYI